jgi:predicted RNA-binding protein YlxR (DUF448 family)
MTRARHVPQRSCVGCRQVRPKPELLRVVRTPSGEVRVDDTGKLAGRGAYICRDETCLGEALRQKRLNRSLGIAIGSDVAEDIRRRLRAGQSCSEG